MAGEGGNCAGDGRCICRFCNKAAVNKVVRCVTCDLMLHRSCCEKKKLEIGVDNTTNCCALTQESDGRDENCTPEAIVTLVEEENRSQFADTVSKHQIEVFYLQTLLKTKDDMIADKCELIREKDHIISLLQAEVNRLRSNFEVNSGKSFPPNVDAVRFDVSNKESELTHPPKNSATFAQRVQSSGKSKIVAAGEARQLNVGAKDLEPKQKSSSRGRQVSAATHIHQDDNQVACGGGGREYQGRVIDSGNNDDLRTRDWRRSGTVVGDCANDIALKGAPQMAYVHVYRLDPKTTVQDVLNYLNQAVEGMECMMLQSRHPELYSSFKLTVPFDRLDFIMNASLWPPGVCVRRFFHRKTTS